VLVAAGSIALAAVAAGAARGRELFLLVPMLWIGGVAWIAVLSTLAPAAPQGRPARGGGRAAGGHFVGFPGAAPGGSALWGAVASHSGLSAAYVGIAAGLLLGAALAIRLKLAADANVDHTPAHHWPDPTVAGAPRLESGPIMIQVEYCVDPPNAEAFRI